jgi:hypothetical protein
VASGTADHDDPFQNSVRVDKGAGGTVDREPWPTATHQEALTQDTPNMRAKIGAPEVGDIDQVSPFHISNNG